MKRRVVQFLIFSIECLLVTLTFAFSAFAQWTISAPNLLGPITANSDYGGAISYRDGNLWMGWKSLFLSKDQGLTFSPIPLTLTSEFILDISFYDQNTGLVVTSAAVYLTRDQGQTWQTILSQASFFSADFMGSANDIIVAGAGPVYVSRDGGTSWATQNIGGSPILSIAQRGSRPIPGTAYVMMDNGRGDYISTTTDYGTTWTQSLNATLPDTYSFAPDSCDQNSFYVANEGAYATLSKLSIIWCTHNNGQTWQQGVVHPRRYFEGSIARGLVAIYAPSIDNGIWRSTDGGSTWSGIGGPSARPDNHLISAITDNLIVAVDSEGSVWRTTNSGGSPVDISSVRQPFVFSPPQLFDHDDLTSCDSAISRTVQLRGLNCIMPRILSDTIVGQNANQYTIISAPTRTLTGNDSVTLSFVTHSAVTYFDTLKVTLDDGEVLWLPLLGTSHPPGHSLTASVKSLFANDTLTICHPLVFRSLTLRDSGCTHRRVIAETIIGAGLHYEVTVALPSLLTGGSDSTQISFTASSPGSYPASLRIVLDDSTILTIPLLGSASSPVRTVSYSPSLVFSQDTITACDSSRKARVVILSRSCTPITVLSQSITGADSDAYRIMQLPTTLTGDDTCLISFSAKRIGNSRGTMLLLLDDSSMISITLAGFVTRGVSKLVLSPASLFKGDTVAVCGSGIERTAVILDSSCITHRIVSVNIVGADSSSYQIVQSLNPQLGVLGDSLVVQFTGDKLGNDSGTIAITLDDSSQIILPLYGSSTTRRFPVLYSPSSLFVGDTLWTCGSSGRASFVLRDTSCPPRKITSQTIVGTDAQHYAIQLRLLPQTGTIEDSSELSFQPDSAYNYIAFDSISFDDGSFLLIPLGGRGRDPILATIASQRLEEDTIGAEISVPIVLGLRGDRGISFQALAANLPNFSFVLHYDTSMLVYKGTVLGPNKISGDVPSQSWAGRGAIQVRGIPIAPDSIVGYVNFEVFPTTSRCANLSFDSIEFENVGPNCSVFKSQSVLSTVCSVISCGTSFLSNFLRYGTTAELTLRPNPAEGHLGVTSTETLGAVRIQFVDALGLVSIETSAILLAGQEIQVQTPAPSGIYFLEVDNGQSKIVKQILVLR